MFSMNINIKLMWLSLYSKEGRVFLFVNDIDNSKLRCLKWIQEGWYEKGKVENAKFGEVEGVGVKLPSSILQEFYTSTNGKLVSSIRLYTKIYVTYSGVQIVEKSALLTTQCKAQYTTHLTQ